MSEAVDRVLEIFRRAASAEPRFPPTEIFSEGWLLRLVMDAHLSGMGGLPIPLVDGARWYSEACLDTAFLRRFKKDPKGDKRGHADGVVGHFRMREDRTAQLILPADATQLVVIEAKMRNRLSKGTSNDPTFDQAARDVAAMAWTIHQSDADLGDLASLAFYVVAPQDRIQADPTFAKWTDKQSIEAKVRRRVGEYWGDRSKMVNLRSFLESTFLPMLNRIEIRPLSWEDLLESVESDHGAELSSFYQECRRHNGLD